jgi:hypothetical protein
MSVSESEARDDLARLSQLLPLFDRGYCGVHRNY